MTMLDLSPELALTLDYMTMATVVYGARGSGKTNLGVVIGEELDAAGQRFCAVDLKGDWWGMKAAADGKSPGISVIIFGGEHADLPLEDGSGATVGQIVAEIQESVIVDLEHFSKGRQIRWLKDFFGALYHHNREPLMVLADEIQRYAPQRPMSPDETLCLAAVEDLIKLGRKHGLGIVCLTQRGAGLNKEVSELCDVLVAMRTPGPIDQERIKDWLDANATREQRDTVMGMLAKLPTGTAVFASGHPDIDLFKVVPIRYRWTFDSSATPKIGEVRRDPKVLAEVDLDALRQRMSETIERAKEDDPKELRARIKALESERNQATIRLGDWIIAAGRHGFDTPDGLSERIAELEQRVERIEVPVLTDESIEKLNATADALSGAAMRVLDAVGEIKAALVSAKQPLNIPENIPEPKRAPLFDPSNPPERRESVKLSRTQAPIRQATGVKISGPQQRILDALAEMEAVGLTDLDRSNVAVYAGASPRSSAFGNNLGALRTGGYIDYPSGGRVCLTDAGRELANAGVAPRTLGELHDAWARHLSGPQTRILGELLAVYPDPIPRDKLADFAGASATSSAYGNNLGHLRGLGLISYPSKGMVCATDLLFPRGLR